MSGVSDLKDHAAALEAEAKYAEALLVFRECVLRLEGTPDFLRELPLLVRIGDLEVRAGDQAAAVASYERALGFYIKHGRTESVIATGLRLARIRPGAAPFFDYTLQLLGAGHVDPARRVLLDVARRTGQGAEANELATLEGALDARIIEAVERIIGNAQPPAVEPDHPEQPMPAAPHRTMSLQDAIAEMRRKSGLAERPGHHEVTAPSPGPPAPWRNRRRRMVALLLVVSVLIGGVGVAFGMTRERRDGVPVVFEGPPPSPRAAAVAAEAPVPPVLPGPARPFPDVRQEPGVNPVAAAPAARADAPRPSTGIGLLAADPNTARLPARAESRPAPPPTFADSAPAPRNALPPDAPHLPAGAVVTRSLVAVRGLPISGVAEAGRGYRLTQPLPGGGALDLVLSPFPGTGVSAPRVTPVPGDSAAGTMRFQGFMVNARAPISPDSLHQLLLRLVEVPPRH